MKKYDFYFVFLSLNRNFAVDKKKFGTCQIQL